jgi:hypothetical protein
MKQHPHCTDPESLPAILRLPIPQALRSEFLRLETRRRFLGRTGQVLGWAALAALGGTGLVRRAAAADALPLSHGSSPSPRFPNFAPKAKRAISLFMSGGPPQQDLWDYKPDLAKLFDKDLPESVRGGQQLTGMTAGQARFPIAPTYFKFSRHGRTGGAGTWISELLPWTAKVVDELAIIRTLYTDAINHEPAQLLFNTGNMVTGKPSLGAWLSYGLGSANENLPTYVVMTSRYPAGVNPQPISAKFWGSGFLPSQHAGVDLRSSGDPVLYLTDPRGVDHATRRAMLDGVNRFNEMTAAETGDPETRTRIAQYEMAFRMQTSVPDLLDFRDEPKSTWDLYGPEAKEPGTFTYNCLLARRLAERGVRFTQIYHRGWDVHSDVVKLLPKLCHDVDRACFALLTDLKSRGLLDETLVTWGGEFGRTVYSQGGLSKENYGRDHHPKCFTVWMAGGGAEPGARHGETDDFSYNVATDGVHVRDYNATILHCLGIDHEKLTFKFQGLDQKLTGVVPARVVKEVLA